MARGGGGFESHYFENLYELEAGNFWFRARNELILWALDTYGAHVRSLLEIGCGTGYVLSGIARSHPQIELVGSEIFVDGLGYASKRLPNVEFMQMDARRLPYDREFDAIGAFDVLEHIDDDGRVVNQLHQALSPGGILLLTVPQHPFLWSAPDVYAHHVRRYRLGELEGKLSDRGLEVLRSTSFVSLLLPAMVVSRWRTGTSTTGYDPSAELTLSPRLDSLLHRLMRAESFLIRRGLNLPVGGSRLIVARKT